MRSKEDRLASNKERTIRAIADDISYLLEQGLTIAEIWESIDISNYSYRATKEDKMAAFSRYGYKREEA